jgi:hypothetical protein
LAHQAIQKPTVCRYAGQTGKRGENHETTGEAAAEITGIKINNDSYGDIFMTCLFCGGYVEWKGSLLNLTHTECEKCGRINCQEPENYDQEEYEESDLPDITINTDEVTQTVCKV